MQRLIPTFALSALLLAASGVAYAEDAMAPATDAMMAPMSDEDLAKCMTQAGMITFPDVMAMAQAGCQAMKDGKIGDMMGAMGVHPMAGDAMAPAADAMAPAADAMAPAK